jgi:hypothetical protein
MCKWIKSGNTRIDPCMKQAIAFFKLRKVKTLASCCGHNKYPPSVVVECEGQIMEVYSGAILPRKKRFYKRDSEGHFFIPEVI